MRLLLDTDALCKLLIGGLLDDLIAFLGVSITDCQRLPALPHMLRRGRLRERLGEATCDAIVPVAEAIPLIESPNAKWLEPLALVPSIDPGEALVFAAAAEQAAMVLTGDKRALRALAHVPVVARQLQGQIVPLEAALLALCSVLGVEEVRRRVTPLRPFDGMVRLCFSAGCSDPRDCLRSHLDQLAAEIAPLALWTPAQGEAR